MTVFCNNNFLFVLNLHCIRAAFSVLLLKHLITQILCQGSINYLFITNKWGGGGKKCTLSLRRNLFEIPLWRVYCMSRQRLYFAQPHIRNICIFRTTPYHCDTWVIPRGL